MNISEALFRNAYYSPQQLAMVDRRRSLTYSEFHQRVNRLSHYLFKSVRAQIETSRSNLPTSNKDYVPARLYNEIAETLDAMEVEHRKAIDTNLGPIEKQLIELISRDNNRLTADSLQAEKIICG